MWPFKGPTGNIWCNFCVDKWEAKFPGCKAYGHNSAWAGPGRAPFFGCQVAPGQSCGGAVQSAPSNWNVDWSAGTDPCLFLSHWRTCMHTSTHIRLRTSFCVFILSKSIGNFLPRPGNPRIWDKNTFVSKRSKPLSNGTKEWNQVTDKFLGRLRSIPCKTILPKS